MDKIKPLYDAIQMHRGQYSSGGADYSVTTLLDPPRVVFLNKRHLHKVKLYVEDLLHSYNGTGAHDYWEKMLTLIPNTPYECETRLSHTVNNRVVSGAFDCVYNETVMYDMKNTSVWKMMFGSKDDWAAQQNIYRWLYWNDRKRLLKELRIVGLFRDWSLRELQRGGPKYPRYPAMEIKLPVWDLDDAFDFMAERVNTMIAHEDTPDDELPLCSYEDMWSEPDKVAVMSTRLKSRAVRVLSDMPTAKAFVNKYLADKNCKDSVKTLSYEIRPATRKRCEDWCPVNKYCNQYNDFLQAKAKGGK
jgi:hypothetical protein